MFGFNAGRRLPLLIIALLVVIGAGLYIRYQFDRVQGSISTQDPQKTAQQSSALLVAEPRPATIDRSLADAQAAQVRRYDDAATTEPAGTGTVQPDRPVRPDVPLQH
jgi:hypothetical protein